jgi:hypothetical protein
LVWKVLVELFLTYLSCEVYHRNNHKIKS